MLGTAILLLLTLSAVFAPAIAPYSISAKDTSIGDAPPSAEHWLGTDKLGQDEWSRLLYGGRVTLLVGVVSALIATAAGVAVGAASGYFGGRVDAVLMRFVDFVLAFPAIFLLLILGALANPSLASLILFLALFSWMWLARVVRGEFLSMNQREFIQAARAIGASNGRIISRHMLPNAAAAVIVSATLNVAYAMLSEASLSYLGLGVGTKTLSWGSMLEAGKGYALTLPLRVLAPGLALTLAVLAINWVGDGLRDALDPRS